MNNTKIELLSPAGTIRNMRYAFAFSADAVYAGQPRYSLRVRNNDFQLDALANRGYTDAFYTRKRASDTQNYTTGNSKFDGQRFVGEVIAYDAEQKLAEVIVKNKFSVGDHIELINPDGNITFKLESMHDARHGKAMDVAPGSGHQVKIPLPAAADKHALLAVNWNH